MIKIRIDKNLTDQHPVKPLNPAIDNACDTLFLPP